MTNPPKESWSVEDALSAMRSGTEYRFPIRCRQFSFYARPLSVSEESSVLREARDEMKPDSPEFEHASVLAQKYLVASSTTPEQLAARQMGPIQTYLLSKATADEINFMYKQYISIVEKCNPALEEMETARITELVEGVKKKGLNLSTLIELSLPELAAISLHSLKLLEESPADSSPGSQSTES